MSEAMILKLQNEIKALENRIKELEEKQARIEEKLQRVEAVLNVIEKDIYEEEGYDFEIVCPYCNHEFITEFDETKTEIKCPECKNMIELDWNDEEECEGDCCGCHGCGEDEEFQDEEDDM